MVDSGYQARKKWNAENYKQVNIAVRPDLVESFKATCERNGLPMREVFIRLMTDYAGAEATIDRQEKKKEDYSRLPLRRKAVARIISQLEEIKENQEQYIDNMPDGLKSSIRYEEAEEFLALLVGALDALGG